MNQEPYKFHLIVILLFITILATVLFSTSAYNAQKSDQFILLLKNQVIFEDTKDNCLIRAIVAREELTRKKLPAKVLAFHCRKPTGESMGHAVTIWEYQDNLFIFDNGGSAAICSLKQLNLKSNPAEIITKCGYIFVKNAYWVNKF